MTEEIWYRFPEFAVRVSVADDGQWTFENWAAGKRFATTNCGAQAGILRLTEIVQELRLTSAPPPPAPKGSLN